MFAAFDSVDLSAVFSTQGVSCYQLQGGDFQNSYYVVSEQGTQKLLEKPEIVGYEVYTCLIRSSAQMMGYFYENGKVRRANILSILRGALNYPLEESCYLQQIPVHDISFLSSERVFHNDEIAGLEIKYSKLALVPDSTLLIGDIVATGETLIHCLRYVTEHYRKHGAKLRNIILFTIGGGTGITIMEQMTAEIREFWPEFEGFIAVFYEGIFSTYENKGVLGIQRPDIDFYWKNGIVAPEFREYILSRPYALFEKCIIYDGGARRYEIRDHIDEVLEYWEKIVNLPKDVPMKDFLEERLGHSFPITKEDWIRINHYGLIDEKTCDRLYTQECEFYREAKNASLKKIAQTRISQIESALSIYQT